MHELYKRQSASKSILPERHTEMRISEGLLVVCLFAVLILVLFP